MFQEGFFLPLETYAIIVIPLVIPVGENTSSSYPQSLQKMIGEVSAFLCNLYPNLLVFLRSSYFAQIETCKKKWFLEGTPFTKVWATWMFFQFWFPALLISPLLSLKPWFQTRSLVHCHLLGRFSLLPEGGGCLFLNTLGMQELILLIWWGILVQTAVPKCLRLSGLNNKHLFLNFWKQRHLGTASSGVRWDPASWIVCEWQRVEASSHVSPYNGTNLIHEDFTLMV